MITRRANKNTNTSTNYYYYSIRWSSSTTVLLLLLQLLLSGGTTGTMSLLTNTNTNTNTNRRALQISGTEQSTFIGSCGSSLTAAGNNNNGEITTDMVASYLNTQLNTNGRTFAEYPFQIQYQFAIQSGADGVIGTLELEAIAEFCSQVWVLFDTVLGTYCVRCCTVLYYYIIIIIGL